MRVATTRGAPRWLPAVLVANRENNGSFPVLPGVWQELASRAGLGQLILNYGDGSEIARRWWQLSYGCRGERGSREMVRAAGMVASDLLAFGKQVGIGCIGRCASWR
jgi:hypothetical protein